MSDTGLQEKRDALIEQFGNQVFTFDGLRSLLGAYAQAVRDDEKERCAADPTRWLRGREWSEEQADDMVGLIRIGTRPASAIRAQKE